MLFAFSLSQRSESTPFMIQPTDLPPLRLPIDDLYTCAIGGVTDGGRVAKSVDVFAESVRKRRGFGTRRQRAPSRDDWLERARPTKSLVGLALRVFLHALQFLLLCLFDVNQPVLLLRN
jgi:hypothetical protein